MPRDSSTAGWRCLFSKLWRKLVFPVVLRSREHSEHAAPNFGELLHGRQAVSRSRRRSHLVLTNNVGHADHEEFVKIVVENGEELELFKQRHAQIAGFFEHLAVEFNPIELTVNVEKRIGEVWHAFYGRQRGRRRFERSRTGSGNFDRFDSFYAFRAFDRLRDRLFRRRAAADRGFLTAVCSLFTSASAGLTSIPAGWTAAGLSVFAVDSLTAVSAPSVWSAQAALRLRVGLSDIECFHRK